MNRIRLSQCCSGLLLAALSAPCLTAATALGQDGTNPNRNVSNAQSHLSPNDQTANDAMWERAQKMYAQNDFAQASSAAGKVTAPSLRKNAQAMLAQIQSYVAALQDGVAAESRHDAVAAIKAYASAVRIKSDGPGDPAARIVRVQQQAAAGQSIMEQQAKDKLAQRTLLHHNRALQLLKKGAALEAAGDLRGALLSYQAAGAAEPTNATAAEAAQRLQSSLNSSQSSMNLSAADGIRAFYAGRYAEAEQKLAALLSTPDAKHQGAAYFYLGASKYLRATMEHETPKTTAMRDPDVVSALHHAHALGYVPLPRYVSPALLELWKSTS